MKCFLLHHAPMILSESLRLRSCCAFFGQTLAYLEERRTTDRDFTYEIIVVDDGSKGTRMHVLSTPGNISNSVH